MMMLGSKYGADAQGGLDVVGYFILEWVPKPTPSGVTLTRRDPAPEVLLGDPVLARAATRVAPGDLKYRSLVLSFGPEDIDAAAFNAGCPDSRAKIDFALQLYCEVAFAGIPKACRPPLFVSTHTHTVRMELNIMVPRWVRRPDGAIRSFNPDPPGKGGRALWSAFEDLLNARFGWADPRDPASQRLITLPSWLLKQKAEALRSGLAWTPSARERVTDALITAVEAREIANRSELLTYIERWCSQNDMVVHNTSAAHVTIGVSGAVAKDRIRLKGLILAEEGPFSALLDRTEPTAEQHSQRRRMMLEQACKQLQGAFEKRAAFNGSRFGQDQWPACDFDAEVFAFGPLPPTLNLIPPTRIARTAKEPDDDSRHFSTYIPLQPDEPRTGTAPESGRVGSGPGRTSGAAGSEDCRAGGGDQGREGSSHPLDRFADLLAGPRGPGRVLSALARRVSKVLPKLAARLTLRRVAAAIPDHLPNTLNHRRTALENLNVTLTKTAHAVTAGQHATHDYRRGGPETRSDSARDFAASRSAQGAGKVGPDAHSASRRGHARTRCDRRSFESVSRGSGAAHTSRAFAAGASDRVRSSERADGSDGETSQHPEQLAGRADPHLCRADIIRHILSLCDERDPGSPRSLRRVTEADPDNPSMQDALRLSFAPDDHWVLCASEAAQKAVADDPLVQTWAGQDVGRDMTDECEFGF